MCLNSFELDRHDRLGYHAIVANWGGGMRPEQLGWVRREIEEATASGMLTVALLHHDPRGGSLGKDLGQAAQREAAPPYGPDLSGKWGR